MRTLQIVSLVLVVGVAAAVTTVTVRRASQAAADATPAGAACPANAKKADLSFAMKDVDGRTVRLSDFAGKVVLLDFWATWCAPCKVEIPGFVDLYAKYRSRGLEVVGVVVLDEFKKAKPFANDLRMNYTILDGVDREDLDNAFGPFFGLPMSFLIGRDGRICGKHLGLPPTRGSTGPIEKAVQDVFEKEIRSLL
jgi:peroxiredoxin